MKKRHSLSLNHQKKFVKITFLNCFEPNSFARKFGCKFLLGAWLLPIVRGRCALLNVEVWQSIIVRGRTVK